MTIDADDPIDTVRNFIGDVAQKGHHVGDLFLSAGLQRCRGAFKENLRGEDETVANDLYAFAVTEKLTQRAEKFRAISCQFTCFVSEPFGLDAQPFGFRSLKFGPALFFLRSSGKRGVQLRAKCFDTDLRFAVPFGCDVEKVLQRAKFGAQGRNLFVQRGDLALAFG